MTSRYTIVILTGVILAAATGAVVTSALQASRVLDATGLHIYGVDGKLYARLESWESTLQEDEGEQSTNNSGAHLVFYDGNGNSRLRLGTSEQGANVSFFDTSGTEQLSIRLHDVGGPNLRLSDPTGRTLFEANPQ